MRFGTALRRVWGDFTLHVDEAPLPLLLRGCRRLISRGRAGSLRSAARVLFLVFAAMQQNGGILEF